MRANIASLVQTHTKEFNKVEETYLAERKSLRDSNAEELESLFSERRAKEEKFMELKRERSEEARKQIEELRILEAEEYHELKIKLETEIQTLEQHLQEVKCVVYFH